MTSTVQSAVALTVVALLPVVAPCVAAPAGATPPGTVSAAGGETPVLVAVDCDPVSAVGTTWQETMQERGAVLHVGRDVLIARIDPAVLRELRAAAAVAVVLDRNAGAESTYLGVEILDARGRAQAARLGSVLFERDRFLVVRRADTIPDDFRLEGIEAVVPLRPLPPRSAVVPAPAPAPPAGARRDVIADIVAAVSDVDYQEVIADLEGFVSRNARGTGYWNAANYAHDRFEFYGVPAEIEEFEADPWWGDPFTCWNVVAEKTGLLHPEQIYVICGHLDATAGNPSIPESVAPGADDNGSGSASVLEAARILSAYDFDATVRFICFGAEEQGLCGSAVYATAAAAAGDQILGVLNLDMLLYGPPGHDTMRIRYNSPSQPLAQAFQTAAATHVPALDVFLDYAPGSMGSDHYSFWQHGYAALEGIEEYLSGNPYYHQTSDRLANYMAYFPFGANCFRGALATLATLAGPNVAAGIEGPVAGGAAAPAAGLEIATVAPHPVFERARLTLHTVLAAPHVLALYDVTGRERWRTSLGVGGGTGQQPRTLEVELGLPELPEGVYLLRATDGRQTATRKLVIAR
ncbi:MAG: M28 family peptidase [Candidatus Eiseniibacteriota bacterium]